MTWEAYRSLLHAQSKGLNLHLSLEVLTIWTNLLGLRLFGALSMIRKELPCVVYCIDCCGSLQTVD